MDQQAEALRVIWTEIIPRLEEQCQSHREWVRVDDALHIVGGAP